MFLKRCLDCEELKPTHAFSPDKRTVDGRYPYCRPCHKPRVAASRSRSPNRPNHTRHATRVLASEGRLTLSERAVRRSVKKGQRHKQWRVANPERYREIGRAGSATRYARKTAAEGTANADQRKARWDYYGGKCWMCGAEATQMDHVIALKIGGSNWPANLRPACGPCNRFKWAKPLAQLAS